MLDLEKVRQQVRPIADYHVNGLLISPQSVYTRNMDTLITIVYLLIKEIERLRRQKEIQ